jgi:hypothetical protein
MYASDLEKISTYKQVVCEKKGTSVLIQP